MTLEISKLSNGLTVVTDPMPGLESAALGVWVNTGSRNETPAPDGRLPHAGAYGVQGHRHAQRPRHRRRDRSGGRRAQRLYQPRADRLSCPRAEGRCAAGAGHDRRHSHQPDLRRRPSWSASARWCCRSWARRATRPTTSCSIICSRRSIKDQPLGWPILGEEATVNAFNRDMLQDLHGVAISRWTA